MTYVLRWEEPPASRTGRAGPRPRPSLYDAIADELRTEPQRWGVVFEGNSKSATSIANQMRRGVLGTFLPTGDFEIASRVDGDIGLIYARYVGGAR